MPAQTQTPTPKPNAWANRSASSTTATPASSTAGNPGSGASTGATTPSAVEDKYVPVGGFNAEEVGNWMKKSSAAMTAIKAATEGDTNGSSRWTAATASADSKTAPAPKSGGAWGQKPSIMANGQDFWVQLKKQLAAGQLGG